MKIRSLTISHCIKKSREEKDVFKGLELEIQSLENSVNLNPSEIDVTSLNQKKCELEKRRQTLVEGLILRSRVNWHENGERCTNYFCKLEKKAFLNKTMTELIDDQGNQISDQSKILFEQEQFYRTLYTSKSFSNDDNHFFNHDIKLSAEQKLLCEGNLSFRECGEALKQMQNGKSPGSDGFTVDFFKFFWKDIGPFVFRSLQFGYELGHFSDFQYQSIITCIPKEGKDRRYMGNWRPISLMNTDMKIASAVLAGRAKKVLFAIISDTQKGFMKGRFIGENTRLLYDLMHYLEKNDIEGLLLLVDFEKAFDSIEWDFLKQALISFNFGPSFCKWFDVLYADAKSCVINNGNMSQFFNLERGCRQGDPLSPYLFIIGVELLAIQLKGNPKIKGVNINGNLPLISQYADDTFLTLDGSEDSLKETLSCFEKFHKVSGLKINTTKTKVVWIGSKRYSDLVLCPETNLSWSCSNFKVLGLNFSLDLECMPSLNFRAKIIDISKLLKSWQHRKLTLLGKVTVIKTLALPKLIHLLTSLPNICQSMLNEINRLFFNFIWDGKTEKIKRDTLIADKKEGGLKMVHLQSFNFYLKVGWVRRFFSNLNGDWQNILKLILKKFGGARSFSLQNFKFLEIGNQLSNPFWKDVFQALHSSKPHVKTDVKECLSMDILNFVKTEDFPLYNRWGVAGVQNLCHIFDHQRRDFFTFDQIKQKVQTNNYMHYYSLISNIPMEVKQCIRENTDTDLENFTPQEKFLEKITSSKNIKFIYNNLIVNVHILQL